MARHGCYVDSGILGPVWVEGLTLEMAQTAPLMVKTLSGVLKLINPLHAIGCSATDDRLNEASKLIQSVLVRDSRSVILMAFDVTKKHPHDMTPLDPREVLSAERISEMADKYDVLEIRQSAEMVRSLRRMYRAGQTGEGVGT